MKRKLEETLNFCELYKHYVGHREVPPQYDRWACFSLIAASVGKRVWIEKFTGSKLAPNLYVILIGPSGCGKGVAVDDATIPYATRTPKLNHYRGKATAPYLVDFLGKTKKSELENKWVIDSRSIYLLTPELSLSVGSGPLAEEFIKMMTELFTGGDYDYQHGTRTRGNVTIRGHCVNWLGASTESWFVRALSQDAIESGALARMVTIGGRGPMSLITWSTYSSFLMAGQPS